MTKRRTVPEGKQRLRVSEGVYLKPNGKYLATFRDPGRKQQWCEFTTKKEAVDWRARGRLDPLSVITGKRTLREAWEGFLDHHGSSLRPTTLAGWTQQWRKYIDPQLGSWPIGKITIPVVKDFLADLERRGVGGPTRAKCRSILHRVMGEAVENREIPSNPVAARGTRVKPNQRKRARVLMPPEVASAIRAAEELFGPQEGLALELMFSLGLRIGEMAGLQAADVDSARNEVTIRRTVTEAGGHLLVQDATKSNRYRVLPVPDVLPVWSRLLDHLKTTGRIGQAHVFQAPRGGPLRPNNWRKRVWARALGEAAIADPPTPHSARRTTASLLTSLGVPPATVQAILGHSTLQQTGEYIAVPRSDMEAGLGRLASVLGRKGSG